MTDLLYLPDADDVTAFEATATEVTDEYVVLDEYGAATVGDALAVEGTTDLPVSGFEVSRFE